jgi:hypothetical protein
LKFHVVLGSAASSLEVWLEVADCRDRAFCFIVLAGLMRRPAESIKAAECLLSRTMMMWADSNLLAAGRRIDAATHNRWPDNSPVVTPIERALE